MIGPGLILGPSGRVSLGQAGQGFRLDLKYDEIMTSVVD